LFARPLLSFLRVTANAAHNYRNQREFCGIFTRLLRALLLALLRIANKGRVVMLAVSNPSPTELPISVAPDLYLQHKRVELREENANHS
jgi:hypothetical protein